MAIILLLLVASALAKENFRVVNGTGQSLTQAVQQCFGAGLCTLATGCCNGHGYCRGNATSSAQCVCDLAPQECRPGLSPVPNYSGAQCQNYPSDCCVSEDGTDILLFPWKGTCGLRTGVDPERGSIGNLFTRIGGSNFGGTNKVSDPPTWPKNYTQMVSELTNITRGSTLTQFNMMTLGFLQVALKDTADPEYNYNASVTLYNVTYPLLKWQQNTGVQYGNLSVPKQFANNATAVIDLGPLYHWGHRKQYGSYISPHFDMTDALYHWQNVHHMSQEFIVALTFYGNYHYYVARNLEEYLCGQNSASGPITNTCTIRSAFTSDQALWDYIFHQARRSTIRFSQNLLQQSVLQLLIEYGGNDGLWDPTFYLWWRRDTYPSMGLGWMPDTMVNINTHQEWDGDITRTNMDIPILGAIDFFHSMRNPNLNYSTGAMIAANCSGIVPTNFSETVITLLHTQTQRWGGQIHYPADAALAFYRADEMGLPAYLYHVEGLKNNTNITGLDNCTHVYLGSHRETNPTRQYYATIASVALASAIHIEDVSIIDEMAYYHFDVNGMWTGHLYHPDPTYFPEPASSFDYCYQSGGSCTTVSSNAATMLFGYSPDMDPFEAPEFDRSRGALFPEPFMGYSYVPTAQFDDHTDFQTRRDYQYATLPEFLNTMFYQYDGMGSLAYKQVGSLTQYLPNQLADTVPTNVGWYSYFDGFCFAPQYFSPTCSRSNTDRDTGTCTYWWNGPLGG